MPLVEQNLKMILLPIKRVQIVCQVKFFRTQVRVLQIMIKNKNWRFILFKTKLIYGFKRKREMRYSTIKLMQKHFDSAKAVEGSLTLDCLLLCILGVHKIEH